MCSSCQRSVLVERQLQTRPIWMLNSRRSSWQELCALLVDQMGACWFAGDDRLTKTLMKPAELQAGHTSKDKENLMMASKEERPSFAGQRLWYARPRAGGKMGQPCQEQTSIFGWGHTATKAVTRACPHSRTPGVLSATPAAAALTAPSRQRAARPPSTMLVIHLRPAVLASPLVLGAARTSATLGTSLSAGAMEAQASSMLATASRTCPPTSPS